MTAQGPSRNKQLLAFSNVEPLADSFTYTYKVFIYIYIIIIIICAIDLICVQRVFKIVSLGCICVCIKKVASF